MSEVSGNTPFTFSVDSGQVYQASGEFTGLPAGSYYVFVKDANGCINIPDTAVSITEPEALGIGRVITSVSCFEGDDGTISVTPSGGTPGYTYLWSNEETTPEITGLIAGTYTVTVTDANDCSLDSTFTVREPDELIITEILINGSTITISANGGVLPYLYDIGGDQQSESVFQDVDPGQYTVTVTDDNSCTVDSLIEVTDLFDITFNESVTIYPNPSSGQLTVEIGNPEARDMVMEIINLQGQLIMKRELEYNGEPRFIETIDLGDAKGTYFMRVDGLPVNAKIIVE